MGLPKHDKLIFTYQFEHNKKLKFPKVFEENESILTNNHFETDIYKIKFVAI